MSKAQRTRKEAAPGVAARARTGVPHDPGHARQVPHHGGGVSVREVADNGQRAGRGEQGGALRGDGGERQRERRGGGHLKDAGRGGYNHMFGVKLDGCAGSIEKRLLSPVASRKRVTSLQEGGGAHGQRVDEQGSVLPQGVAHRHVHCAGRRDRHHSAPRCTAEITNRKIHAAGRISLVRSSPSPWRRTRKGDRPAQGLEVPQNGHLTDITDRQRRIASAAEADSSLAHC